MKPTLHRRYERKDAIALFDQPDRMKELCEGECVILKDVVLCFANIGNPKEESHFRRPSEFTWRPKDVTDDPTDKWAWLPREVRDVWDAAQQKTTRMHHLFIKGKADKQYVYLGPAHLGRYGNTITGKEADFTLSHKLSRELWIYFGGNSGWEVEVNHVVYSIKQGDHEALNRAIDPIYEQEFSHVMLVVS